MVLIEKAWSLEVRVRAEKSTGEAFAEYETAEEASEAQEDRNNKNLGERYIE